MVLERAPQLDQRFNSKRPSRLSLNASIFIWLIASFLNFLDPADQRSYLNFDIVLILWLPKSKAILHSITKRKVKHQQEQGSRCL